MKLVIQRVRHAEVAVEGTITGVIERGYLVLLGVGQGDTEEDVRKYAQKMLKLRIFPDENDKINRSLADIGGSILAVSQFTLYADVNKGNRPSFTTAGEPTEAKRLYEYFVQFCREQGYTVETGIFGAHMEVTLTNDGPFTVVVENL